MLVRCSRRSKIKCILISIPQIPLLNSIKYAQRRFFQYKSAEKISLPILISSHFLKYFNYLIRPQPVAYVGVAKELRRDTVVIFFKNGAFIWRNKGGFVDSLG